MLVGTVFALLAVVMAITQRIRRLLDEPKTVCASRVFNRGEVPRVLPVCVVAALVSLVVTQ